MTSIAPRPSNSGVQAAHIASRMGFSGPALEVPFDRRRRWLIEPDARLVHCGHRSGVEHSVSSVRRQVAIWGCAPCLPAHSALPRPYPHLQCRCWADSRAASKGYGRVLALGGRVCLFPPLPPLRPPAPPVDIYT